MAASIINLPVQNCLICGADESMNHVSLRSTTSASNRLISEFIEDVLNVEITQNLHDDGNICHSCYDKFNDLDEHMMQVDTIKASLVHIFEMNNTEEHLIEEDEDAQMQIQAQGIVKNEQIIEDDLINETEIYESQKFEDESFSKNNPSNMVEWCGDDDESKPYRCSICSRRFKESSKLKAHILTHTDERNIVCPVCDKRFKTAACLRSHRRIHSDAKIACEMCPRTFISKSEMERHFRQTHQDRDFLCQYCDYVAETRADLSAHEKTHVGYGEKQKKCPQCPATFTTNGKLNRHMKSHSKEYEHSCGICGKQFLYSYNVHAHMKQVHDGQKRSAPSIPCDICQKKFRNELSLKQHLQKEHQYYDDSSMIIAEELVEGIVEVEES